jgi:hypothetical protein
MRSTSLDPTERERARCLPLLPSGYEAQAAWGFRDRTGRFSYEFNRVYGPPNRLDKRGPTSRLDEDLSYWGVTWPTFSDTGDERPAGRWVSYAQARKLRGSRLTFERFSCLLSIRDELPELLHVADVSQDPRSAVSLPSAPELPPPRGGAADLVNPQLHAGASRSVSAPTRGAVAVETEEPAHGP